MLFFLSLSLHRDQKPISGSGDGLGAPRLIFFLLRLLADDCSNLFLPCDVSRSKKTAPIIICDPGVQFKEVAASAASADRASVFLHFNFQDPRKVCVFLMRVEKLMSFTHAHIHPFPAAAARGPCFYQGGGFLGGAGRRKNCQDMR